jgi:hypothetical protein
MNCRTHTASSTTPSPPISRKLAKKQEAFQDTRVLQPHRNIAKDLSWLVRDSRWRAPHMQREPLNSRPPYLPRNIDRCLETCRLPRQANANCRFSEGKWGSGDDWRMGTEVKSVE